LPHQKTSPGRNSLRRSSSPDTFVWVSRGLAGGLALLSLIGFLGLISLDGVVSGAIGIAFTDLFGRSAWLAMLVLFGLGSGALLGSIFGRDFISGANSVAGLLFIIAIAALIHLSSGLEGQPSGPAGGGIIGYHVGWNLQRAVGGFGAFILLILTVIAGLTFSLRLPLVSVRNVRLVGRWAIAAALWVGRRTFRFIDRLESRGVGEAPTGETSSAPQKSAHAQPDEKSNGWEQQPLLKIKNTTPITNGASSGRDAPTASGPWQLPGLELFDPVADRERVSPDEIEENAAIIESTLASFGVEARVVEAVPGPVVTQYCLSPSAGVKVARINSLSNDLALALSAHSVRIEAPIPGRPYVGLEFPNRNPATVSMREMLDTPEFADSPDPLAIALGKDVADEARVQSLSTMPHLLIAGATGAGKSVFLNSILISLIFRHTPEELRLVLIDPKMVELVVYNNIPHLKMPVVTRLDEVVSVLAWATQEMTNRYRLLSDTNHRNLASYNKAAEDDGEREKLPHLVIIIDELADLMMTAPAEVERYVCRLAQMARAVGIHLVVATQRPSVDVVTGLIKANFPTRVAFMVSSQVDSRTILDSGGAERLVGRGDMLYASADSGKLTRIQGAMASDDEIHRLVRFWAEQGDAELVTEEEVADAVESGEREDGELITEAVDLVRQFNYASAPLLQRELKVGFRKARKLIVLLEEQGILGPEREGQPSREVIAS
jgi:S-DNA-T family DNA segregation ATPase FtsK/SpoIIIE